MKVIACCDMCGKSFMRYPSQMKPHNFCCRGCLADFSNKVKNPDGYALLKNYTGVSNHMKLLNEEMNSTRMSSETRAKLRRVHLGTGEGKCEYAKYYGRLAHRVAAEQKLGRSLKPGEVVHHMDFNGRNNEAWNLMIFKSNADHCIYHGKLKKFFNSGIITTDVVEEVVPL